MILLIPALLAAEPPPLDIEPFMDEKPAARAFEEQLMCLGTGGFEHRNDPRDAKIIAADVVSGCSDKATTLRGALADVYRRKPGLTPAGTSPEEAAAAYIAEMNARIEFVILESRRRQ